MKISDAIDRLEKQIADKATPSTIKGTLESIREQAEAMETEISNVKNSAKVAFNLTEQRVKDLERANTLMTAELALLKTPPPKPLIDSAERYLLALFDSLAGATAPQLAGLTHINANEVRYYLDQLYERELIEPIKSEGNIGVPLLNRVTEKGRAYVMENRLRERFPPFGQRGMS